MKTFLSVFLLGSPALAEYFALYTATATGLVNTLIFDVPSKQIKVVQNLTDCGVYPTFELDRDSNNLYCVVLDPGEDPTQMKPGLVQYPIVNFGNLEDILDKQGKVVVDRAKEGDYSAVNGTKKKFIAAVSRYVPVLRS